MFVMGLRPRCTPSSDTYGTKCSPQCSTLYFATETTMLITPQVSMCCFESCNPCFTSCSQGSGGHHQYNGAVKILVDSLVCAGRGGLRKRMRVLGEGDAVLLLYATSMTGIIFGVCTTPSLGSEYNPMRSQWKCCVRSTSPFGPQT